MNDFYTYAFLREDRTPYYIGKGTGNRIYSKKRRIHPPKDKSRIIYLKQNLTEAEAFRHEIYMIAVFGRKDLGTGILYNRTDGGEGSSGFIHSEESKRKLSIAGKGKTLSEETRRKISEAHKGGNHYLYGKTPSEETKRKMRESRKGRIFSDETKRKISEAHKGNTYNLGKTHSEETKKRIGRGNKGKIVSEKTRKKQSESAKVKIFSKEHRKNIGDATRKSYLNMTLEKKIEIAKKQSKAYSNKTSEQKSELAKKSSESAKGRKYWNNGITNILVRECPGGGWKLGRIASEKMKGRKWWNNGITNTITKECPGNDWKPGMK